MGDGPPLGDGLRVRQLRADDAEPFAALVARAVAAGELAASADPHAEWTTRFALRDAAESAVAELDGALAGFVLPEAKLLVVAPEARRRGVGRALAEAALGVERGRGHAEAILGVLPGDGTGTAFLAACGFAYHSTVYDMAVPPGRAVAPPVLPDWVTARPFVSPGDIPAWVELSNAAFADHPTPLQLDLDRTIADWHAWPTRDEDLLLLVDGEGRLAASCCTEPKRRAEGGVEPAAEIWTIAVRPDLQGRGLGRQLVRWGVHWLRSLGVETVTLIVNARNESALALYESEGFDRVASRERWAKPVPAA
jgi:mycothiol synthase